MYKKFVIILFIPLYSFSADKYLINNGNVVYEQEKIDSCEAFYSEDGWGREPLTRHLAIPGVIVGKIFPKAQKELSTLAQIDGVPIGHCDANWWQCNWLEQLLNNLNEISKANLNDGNIQKFVEILFAAFKTEVDELKALFVSKKIPLHKVAHNAGLMVLNDYGQKGIGAMLFEKNLTLLVQQGASAVVVETTNRFSAQIMQKHEFIKCKSFSYKDDFGVDLDDHYTIWYKIL